MSGANRGIWHCNSQSCHEALGSDLLGLLKGLEGNFSGALRVAEELTRDENAPSLFLYQNLGVFTQDVEDEVLIKEEDSWGKLEIPSPYYLARGFSREALAEFGVGDCWDKGSPFWGRAVFPIRSHCGSGVVGAVGRTLTDSPVKWKNSANLKTGNYLYGLWLAEAKMVKTHTAILLEGQGDVIRMHEAGHTNSVGMFGKSLVASQAKILEKLGIMTLVILTDNDSAGVKGWESIKRNYGNRFNLRRPSFSAKDIGDLSVTEIQELKLCP